MILYVCMCVRVYVYVCMGICIYFINHPQQDDVFIHIINNNFMVLNCVIMGFIFYLFMVIFILFYPFHMIS